MFLGGVTEWVDCNNFFGSDALDDVVRTAVSTDGVDGLFSASPVVSDSLCSGCSLDLGWSSEVDGWTVVAVAEVGGGNNLEETVTGACLWDWDLFWIFFDHVFWDGADVVEGLAFTVDGIFHCAVNDAVSLGSLTGQAVGLS